MQKVHGTATLGAYEAASPRRLIPGSVGGVPSSMFTISKPPPLSLSRPILLSPIELIQEMLRKTGLQVSPSTTWTVWLTRLVCSPVAWLSPALA